jgi:hypothetical protein
VLAVVLLLTMVFILSMVLGTMVLESGSAPPEIVEPVRWSVSWEGDVLTITYVVGSSIPTAELRIVGPKTDVAFTDHDAWLRDWDPVIRAGDGNSMPLLENGTYRVVRTREGRTTTIIKIEKRP